MVEVQKEHETESPSSLIYKFNKRVQRSGILKEAKKRRFKTRKVNRNQRRAAALHRETRRKEIVKAKKLGRF